MQRSIYVVSGHFKTGSTRNEKKPSNFHYYDVEYLYYDSKFDGSKDKGYNFAFLYLLNRIHFDDYRKTIKFCTDEHLNNQTASEYGHY